MENYFIILQLPFIVDSQSFITKNQSCFWQESVNATVYRKLKLISRRKDTGVSEEFRDYIKKTKNFASYILLDMELTNGEVLNNSSLYKKAMQYLKKGDSKIIIDTAEKFNLLAIEA